MPFSISRTAYEFVAPRDLTLTRVENHVPTGGDHYHSPVVTNFTTQKLGNAPPLSLIFSSDRVGTTSLFRRNSPLPQCPQRQRIMSLRQPLALRIPHQFAVI